MISIFFNTSCSVDSVNIFWLEWNIAVREAIISVSRLLRNPDDTITSVRAAPYISCVSEKRDTCSTLACGDALLRLAENDSSSLGTSRAGRERQKKTTGRRANRKCPRMLQVWPRLFILSCAVTGCPSCCHDEWVHTRGSVYAEQWEGWPTFCWRALVASVK